MKLSSSADTWLGLATLLAVAGVVALVAADKPVADTVFPIATLLAGALVHRAGASQGVAASGGPANAPGPEVEHAVQGVDLLTRRMDEIVDSYGRLHAVEAQAGTALKRVGELEGAMRALAVAQVRREQGAPTDHDVRADPRVQAVRDAAVAGQGQMPPPSVQA